MGAALRAARQTVGALEEGLNLSAKSLWPAPGGHAGSGGAGGGHKGGHHGRGKKGSK
jgi:hypothetical protein